MTTLDECMHGIVPESACSWCSGQQARREAEQKAVEANTRTFVAKYESQCAECNLPIRVGDLIKWRPDWPPMHSRCAP